MSSTRKQNKHPRKIAEGTYGCVYSPAIRCNGNTQRAPGVVSKLFKNDFNNVEKKAEDEFAIGQTIRAFNKESRSTITPLAKCEKDPSNVVKKCSGTILLQYPYGGDSLDKVVLAVDEYISYFSSLSQLFDAVQLLHTNDVAHLDMKPPNILVTKNKRGEFHFRLADFGLSMPLKTTVFPQPTNTAYDADYFYWPFDVRFLHTKMYETRDSSQKRTFVINDENLKEFNQMVEFFNGTFYLPTDIFKRSDGTFVVSMPYVHELLGNKRFDTSQPEQAEEWYRFLAKSADIYGLGITLSEIYRRHIGHCYADDINGMFTVTTPGPYGKKPTHVHHLIINAEKYMSPVMSTWHKLVFEEVTKPLYALVRKMMRANPFERISLLDAKREFVDTIVPRFQKWFTPTQIADNVQSLLQYPPPLHSPPSPYFNVPTPEAAAAVSPNNPFLLQNNSQYVDPLKVFRNRPDLYELIPGSVPRFRRKTAAAAVAPAAPAAAAAPNLFEPGSRRVLIRKPFLLQTKPSSRRSRRSRRTRRRNRKH